MRRVILQKRDTNRCASVENRRRNNKRMTPHPLPLSPSDGARESRLSRLGFFKTVEMFLMPNRSQAQIKPPSQKVHPRPVRRGEGWGEGSRSRSRLQSIGMQYPRSHSARRHHISRVGRPALQQVPNLQTDPFQFSSQLAVPNAFCKNPFTFQKLGAFGIRLLPGWVTVARAIDFQREFRFGAVEIQRVRSDWMLPAKFVTGKPSITQQTPERFFSGGLPFAELANSFARFHRRTPHPLPPLPVGPGLRQGFGEARRGEGEPVHTLGFLKLSTHSMSRRFEQPAR